LRFTGVYKKSCKKSPYAARMLFINTFCTKNETLPANRLPVTARSVKNIDNTNLTGNSWKQGTIWPFFLFLISEHENPVVIDIGKKHAGTGRPLE
jgi:hypothetical protein